MSPRRPFRFPVTACLLLAALPAQRQKHVAYPQRDALTPFRAPAEVYAPPDRLFALLRRMQALADDPANAKTFDAEGREVVDHPAWREARLEVDRIGIDAGYLAAVMRTSKNAGDRATAFYAMCFCKQTPYVVNLISHIPGEPERRIREAAYPRAIAYLQANLRKRFGDLTEDEKKAVLLTLPQVGSPAAKAAGIKRLPRDEDHLVELRVIPFFQLLDLDDPLDQAQGLWFLKEVFAVRGDLALLWLEPALPRIRELIAADDGKVREQAIGLLHTIGPKDLRLAKPDEEPRLLQAWADQAARGLFPPIRNLNGAIIQLHPSPERDAIAAAGRQVLADGSIGDPMLGKTKDGLPFRGLRIARVPAELAALAIPVGAVITQVNGTPVTDAAGLLRTLQQQLDAMQHPRVLMVEYVLDGAPHAVEYRLM